SQAITVLFQELYRDSYCSATVRNAMGCLEEQGYLTHPHTSAGRVPTDLGYRYYVEHGLRREDLPGDFPKKLSETLRRVARERESVAEQASQALSDYAQETCVLVMPASSRGRGGRGAHSALRLVVSGASRMMDKPEFSRVEKVRELFRTFEEKSAMIDWLTRPETHSRKAAVTIGQENKPQAFGDCAVVSARYSLGSEGSGVVAVIGSRRMRYARTIPVVESTRDVIEDVLLEDGEKT
ncbi:MAG: hypothetical protein WC352_09425, partial [Candidatus Omnitrophota bacterium]